MNFNLVDGLIQSVDAQSKRAVQIVFTVAMEVKPV